MRSRSRATSPPSAPCSPECRTADCWSMAYSPGGWMTSSRWPMRTHSSPWRIILRPRRPRRCWNWLPAAGRLLRQAAAEVEDLRFSLRFLWTEWSRVVDAWQLVSWGTVSGRAAARSEDSPARTAARDPLVGLLQGSRRSGRARAPDRTAPVRSPGAPAREDGAPAVRVLRGGRGAGHRRGRVTLSGRPRRRVPGRAVFPATSVSGSSRRRSRGGPWG